MEKTKCPKCGGTGKIADDRDVGAYMKAKRKKTLLRQKHLAKALGLSIASVSDLEHGRMAWTHELQVKYLKALA
jgi:transcriptional regulator with XRE-family HTH domain